MAKQQKKITIKSSQHMKEVVAADKHKNRKKEERKNIVCLWKWIASTKCILNHCCTNTTTSHPSTPPPCHHRLEHYNKYFYFNITRVHGPWPSTSALLFAMSSLLCKCLSIDSGRQRPKKGGRGGSSGPKSLQFISALQFFSTPLCFFFFFLFFGQSLYLSGFWYPSLYLGVCVRVWVSLYLCCGTCAANS